ncbi:MAG: sugar ABC transporter permease [Peptoniphilaceae bacterium]|nr:sugar ABC transporter permease [Peptoniphilaceae bacterium]MDY6019015.1 sugar ABC transporter permease [Anaerococcus sp.]
MKGKNKFHKDNIKRGIIMISPVVIGLAIFYIIPFFQNIFYSFTNLNSFGTYEIVGLKNYQDILQDPSIYNAFKNTLIYTIFTVPLILIISMVIANLLNQKIKGIGIYRTLYFLPAITMPVATAMIWKWIYNGQYGLLNQVLAIFHISPKSWIADPNTAMFALILVGVWMGIGMNVVYFLAGLQSIPKSYYEAATLDGASSVKQFFTITIPSLTPTITFVLITTLIGSLQMFDLVYMMIGKDNIAINNTMTIVYLFYQHAIDFGEKGYGAAIACILFVIILLLTALQLKLQKKWNE